MPWVRLDDDFYDHPKIIRLSDGAFRLWVRMIAWANRYLTSGAIPVERLSDKERRLALELVDAGLWEPTDAGWAIHDFLDYQPSAEETKEHRSELSAKRAEAGRKGAQKRWQQPWQTDSNAHGKPMANAMANGKQTDSPEPVPEPLSVITSLPPLLTGGVPEPVENRGGRVDKALEIITVRERDIAGAQIRHPAAWIRTVIEQNRIHHGARLHKLAHEHPEWTPEQLADTINPPAPPVAERPLCAKCNRHTTGLVECPNAHDDCPTLFVLQVLA